MVNIRVPATTANLGPGFDCLGCALNLYADFTFEKMPSGLSISGCPREYQNEKNLVYTAFLEASKAWGVTLPGLRIQVDSPIPPSRGLGSSAAMIVAGVAAASHFSGLAHDKQELLQLAARIEGHPDNAAPAIYGGLCVSVTEENQVYAAQASVHEDIHFLALVPDFALATHAARAALPESISRQDGVYNAGHAALLMRALETGDFPLLAIAMQDRLHQPYRYPLIPGSREIAALARENAADGFCISGAGPTLLCLYHEKDFPARMAKAISRVPGNWQPMELKVDRHGLRVTPGAW